MHIVVPPLDKKKKNSKYSSWFFTISLLSFFDKKYIGDVPLARGFLKILTLLSLVKSLKGYKGW